MYNTFRILHYTFVTITLAGFILRGIWMLIESDLLRAKVTRILPHVNDTFLLLSALGTAWTLGLNPFTTDWLIAKIAGMVFYIALGAVALTYGPTKKIRIVAFVAALACIGYVIAVAITRNPLPGL